jgi:hypothetical protein
VELYIPEMKTWEGWLTILEQTEQHFAGMNVIPHQVSDGVVFEDENMKVTAYHNHHLEPVDGAELFIKPEHIKTEIAVFEEIERQNPLEQKYYVSDRNELV